MFGRYLGFLFAVIMALCRFAYSPANHLSFPKYPPKYAKLPSLPLSAIWRSSSSTMEAPPEGYRKNVGICLINNQKKIFSASRLDIPNSWQMPQGGIDEGEDPRNAAIRELREETGVSSAEIIAEGRIEPETLWRSTLSGPKPIPPDQPKWAPFWLTYDFPPKVRERLNIQWGTDWKGQAQKWFLFKFTGQDQEINLLGDGTEKPEFGEWSWISPEQVIKLAVDFKKPVYKEVLAAFAPHLQ